MGVQVQHKAPLEPTGTTTTVPLGTLVGTRSGDKGGNANVGFWVRDARHYSWLLDLLTEERIRAWLGSSGFTGAIERFEFPNILTVNFILEGILGDGVAANLHPDPQAKCLGSSSEHRRSRSTRVYSRISRRRASDAENQ